MKAMRIHGVTDLTSGDDPLRFEDVPVPQPERDQVLLELDYPTHLWMEKEIKSVANVAPDDIMGFLALADEIPIRPEVVTFPLADANRALRELKAGGIRGAKVLRVR